MIKIINVYKDSRVMELTSSSNLGLGVHTDNNVDLLRFTFDNMIVGTATLLTDLTDTNGDLVAFPLTINQEDNSYDIEITNALVSQPTITIQLEIALEDDTLWHSKQHVLQVVNCLEMEEGEIPTNISSWLATAIRIKGGTSEPIQAASFDTAIANLPSGGAVEVEEKDVNFYDYDGTRLHSYTKTEFLALESMPENPTRTNASGVELYISRSKKLCFNSW